MYFKFAGHSILGKILPTMYSLIHVFDDKYKSSTILHTKNQESNKQIMRGSLQEQLLKSGLATEEQLKQKKKPKPKNKSRIKNAKSGKAHTANKKQSAPKTTPDTNETPKTLGKALRTEIKQLLKANKLNDKTGEIPYNYVINNQVKRFFVNKEQQQGLKDGKLVIVNWNTISYLITTETETELRKLHPTIEVASVEKPEENKKEKDPDDPYADFEIPDDLSW